MTITLAPPKALHEKGRRETNEDFVYPAIGDAEAMASTKIFLVCDGVGGAEKGEEASRIVCEAFAGSLKELDIVSDHDLDRALTLAEYNIDAFIEDHPDAEGMATTLTLVAFDERGATLSHIGDSRIYHLRKGVILFKTNDHSLVNEMVLNNIITSEEAANHPKRNVVSRAIMGRQRPARLDVTRTTDIQPGDHFFLCTDGIFEGISDIMLASIIGDEHTSDDYKMAQILALCREYSKDNFSAYLVRVKSVEQALPLIHTGEVATDTEEAERKGFFPKWMAYFLIFSSLMTLAMIVIVLLSGPTVIPDKRPPEHLQEPVSPSVNRSIYLPDSVQKEYDSFGLDTTNTKLQSDSLSKTTNNQFNKNH